MQKILTSTAHGLVKSITTSFLRVTSVRPTTLVSLILATLLLAACGGGGGGGGGGGAPNPSGVTTNPAGNIGGVFPDDGAVRYTLNITKQSTAPTLSLNVTTTITGACSIAQVGSTALTYGTDNQTTTSFDITFAGTETVGGRCVANFAVNELTDLGIQTRKFARTVTFSAEQAPTLVAELFGDGENIPASMPVIVNVTATKQDAGKSIDITFPASVISDGSPSCTANLARADGRYITAGGISTAVAIYNVRPTIRNTAADCGTFTFTATEGSAPGSTEFSDSISFVDIDTDGDGVLDSIDNCDMIANPDQSNIDGDNEGDVCDNDIDGDNTPNTMDVDADGDGLIELSTAAQLNMMRHNLEGTNLTITAGGAGNRMGCGGGLYSNNTRITTCNGYEQMADIDLNDLPDNAMPGHNWEPIGTCGTDTRCRVAEDAAQYFTARFDGNGFTISNLNINVTSSLIGVGFFGAVAAGIELRNVHIRSGDVRSAEGNVGGLAGFAGGAIIHNATVMLNGVRGGQSTGGLVGEGSNARISYSMATVDEINGGANTGGLVGEGADARISYSMTTVNGINGGEYTGGLVGQASNLHINSSVAISGIIIGSAAQLGGLLGGASNSKTYYSAAIIGNISSTSTVGANAGGLVGSITDGGVINSSYAVANNITADQSIVGGLLGNSGSSAEAVIGSSYAVNNNIVVNLGPRDYVGELFGGLSGDFLFAPPKEVVASYWDTRVTVGPGDRAVQPVSTHGTGQSTVMLQAPTKTGGFTGIYETWGNAYCNPATGGFSDTQGPGFLPVWDLGESDEYPAISCFPNFSPAEQRIAAARALRGESPIQ